MLTSSGPIKDVNLPEVAKRPKPLPWLSLSKIEDTTTLLADCNGPINRPLIAAKKKNVDAENVNKIAIDDDNKFLAEQEKIESSKDQINQ